MRLLSQEAEVTRSLSNLLKYNSFVVKNEESFVIDSNQKILEKLNGIKKNLSAVSAGTQGQPDENGFISGLNARVVETLITPEEEAAALEEKKAEAEEIITSAKNEADNIVSQAHQEAESFLNAARDEGYAAGMREADCRLQERIQSLEAEYAKKERSLKEEYDRKVSKIEPMLVDTLLKVFSKVTHTMAEDKKDMILCLINSVMKNAELSSEFYIRVSPEDYKFALNNQGKIYSAVAKDVHIEITEDSSLGRNQCIIETDAGVFDCSLDIQLENLIRDIRLLSCLND